MTDLEILQSENEHLRLSLLRFALVEYFIDDVKELKKIIKEEASQALSYIDGPPPAPELVGMLPVVSYFKNQQDRLGFIAAVKEAVPGMIAIPVGGK